MIDIIAHAGGLFAALVFVHFFIDWGFQTHNEAMRKHAERWIRVRHCLVYTLGFVPILLLFGLSPLRFILSLAVLFVSHFIEDSYVLVVWWAKHMRRVPVLRFSMAQQEIFKVFKIYIDTPLGCILMIVIDQIIHITFLWVIVALILWP